MEKAASSANQAYARGCSVERRAAGSSGSSRCFSCTWKERRKKARPHAVAQSRKARREGARSSSAQGGRSAASVHPSESRSSASSASLALSLRGGSSAIVHHTLATLAGRRHGRVTDESRGVPSGSSSAYVVHIQGRAALSSYSEREVGKTRRSTASVESYGVALAKKGAQHAAKVSDVTAPSAQKRLAARPTPRVRSTPASR
mmetsp:Transcript_27346/g.89962  ORF Transcript_27346/g.89962 Transcript_27346/m.89962 type:complete len:203 (+) Transcript_27346:132-740(+)